MVRDGHAGARLDPLVDVDELQPEALGEAPADRGLAGAHRTDQDRGWRGIHAAMLAFAAAAQGATRPGDAARTGIRCSILPAVRGPAGAMFGFRITNFARDHVTLPFTEVLAERQSAG
jgi:hypothetical protein